MAAPVHGAAVLALGVLAALSAVGCGSARSRAQPTRAQFIARANAVCRQELAHLGAIEVRAHQLGRRMDSPHVLRQQAAQSQLATARLQALAEPAADSAAIGRWLTARTVAATILVDLAEAPARGAALAVEDVRAQLARARAHAGAEALAYGARDCDAAL